MEKKIATVDNKLILTVIQLRIDTYRGKQHCYWC